MFDKFGYLDNVENFNELAENLLNEGDEAGLRALAEENGIDQAFVEMYLLGEIIGLADATTFALGKIDKEAEELKPTEIMADWVDYVRSQILEKETVAVAARQEERTLAGLIAELLKWSFKHQTEIPADIKKAAGVNAGKVTLGIPGMATAKKIIREYYGG